MRVMIVESNPGLGWLWRRHIERLGYSVDLVTNQKDAVSILLKEHIEVIILDLILEDGSAFAVAEYANYKSPETRVIFVTNTTFFSDGSIFNLFPNAAAFLQSDTPPEDLAAMTEHLAAR